MARTMKERHILNPKKPKVSGVVSNSIKRKKVKSPQKSKANNLLSRRTENNVGEEQYEMNDMNKKTSSPEKGQRSKKALNALSFSILSKVQKQVKECQEEEIHSKYVKSTYKKVLRSGNNFGVVPKSTTIAATTSNATTKRGVPKNKVMIAKEKKVKPLKKKQGRKVRKTKNEKEDLSESEWTEGQNPEFNSPEGATQTIRYRRVNKSLRIPDDSPPPTILDDELDNSSKNVKGDNNKVKVSEEQRKQKEEVTVFTTTASTSRGCSNSRDHTDRTYQRKKEDKKRIAQDQNRDVKDREVDNEQKQSSLWKVALAQVEAAAAKSLQTCNVTSGSARQGSSKQNSVKQNSVNKGNVRMINERQQMELDIVFCVDTTSSMEQYLRATEGQIMQIEESLSMKGDSIDVRFGFVCYRDHPPEESSYLIQVSDLNSCANTLEFIQEQDTQGGGDTPEAVMDGLYAACTSMSWRKNSRKYIIHIADAPPHGDMYTGVIGGFLKRSFVWRDGCPCGLSIEKIARVLNALSIHYRLIRIGDDTDRMANIFRTCIDHFAEIKVQSPHGLDFLLTDMIIKQCMAKQRSYKLNFMEEEEEKKSNSDFNRELERDFSFHQQYSSRYDGEQQAQIPHTVRETPNLYNSNQLSHKYTANQLSRLPLKYTNFALTKKNNISTNPIQYTNQNKHSLIDLEQEDLEDMQTE